VIVQGQIVPSQIVPSQIVPSQIVQGHGELTARFLSVRF
jgi:hypothetical protein